MIFYLDGTPVITANPSIGAGSSATSAIRIFYNTPFLSQDGTITNTLYNDTAFFSRKLTQAEVEELASIGAALFFQQY